MKFNRRSFLRRAGLGAGALMFSGQAAKATKLESFLEQSTSGSVPLVISTWKHGLAANEAAWKILEKPDGRALDAVEAGVMVSEADPAVDSVGLGGLPDRDGRVTLDACIMDELGNCGSVAFLEHILHPISVARKVMEKTQHVMLVGQGALEFALSQGFKKQNLLTPEAKARWKAWLKESQYKPMPINEKNHDTIGMVALDQKMNLAGACTTSGLSWKMRGRVGDSPIIGAGLYVDNLIGAATATGRGEAVIKICGSHLIVMSMKAGMHPTEACKMAAETIIRRQPDAASFNVGFIAINKKGEFGGYSMQPGFEYAVYHKGKNELIKAESVLK